MTLINAIGAGLGLLALVAGSRVLYLYLKGWYAGARAEEKRWPIFPQFDIVPIMFWTAVACLPGGLLLAWWLNNGYWAILSVLALIFFMAGG